MCIVHLYSRGSYFVEGNEIKSFKLNANKYICFTTLEVYKRMTITHLNMTFKITKSIN